jgi:hypothetical protein
MAISCGGYARQGDRCRPRLAVVLISVQLLA